MFIIKDQLGSDVILNSYPPKRIVSLVPSQTELLAYLGLEEEVVGITKFCVHPKNWLKTKATVGGTKKINIEKVIALKPDIIIANKEENLKEDIEQLEAIAPVWVSDVANFEDALQMMQTIGELVNKKETAQILIEDIKNAFAGLNNNDDYLRACYLIWQQPYMTIGGDTFISDMMKHCGFINVYEKETRYPTITLEEIKEKNCSVVLLASEPFPFKEKQRATIQQQLPNTKVILVDGEMFSWYGNRMLLAAQYFKELINYIRSQPKDFSTLA